MSNKNEVHLWVQQLSAFFFTNEKKLPAVLQESLA